MYEQRIQRSMEAMSRKDLGAMTRSFADDAVFEMAGHTSLSGRYAAGPPIEGLFRLATSSGSRRSGSPSSTSPSTNPVGFTYDNTIFVESEVDETSTDGVTIHDQRIAVYEYRRGKLVSVREWRSIRPWQRRSGAMSRRPPRPKGLRRGSSGAASTCLVGRRSPRVPSADAPRHHVHHRLRPVRARRLPGGDVPVLPGRQHHRHLAPGAPVLDP